MTPPPPCPHVRPIPYSYRIVYGQVSPDPVAVLRDLRAAGETTTMPVGMELVGALCLDCSALIGIAVKPPDGSNPPAAPDS